MKRIAWILAPAFLVALGAPIALAGDYGKCTYGTQECLDTMAQKLKTKGWIGVELDDASGQMKITKVMSESPAEKAGFAPGDVLFAVNSVEYSEANKEKLEALRKEMTPGKAFTFTILKEGKDKKDVELTLAPFPDAVMAEWIGKHMLEHASLTPAQE